MSINTVSLRIAMRQRSRATHRKSGWRVKARNMTGWSLTIAMKKSKFTESQIVFALQQAESGVTVAEVCRKLGISEATFYSWKKKYGGLGPVELRRLRQLEEENAQLKRIVADLTLDKQMLQDVLKKKL